MNRYSSKLGDPNKQKRNLVITSLFLVLLFLITWFNIKNEKEKKHLIILEKPIKLQDTIMRWKNDIHVNRVYILFSLNDCPLCLYEAEFWGKTQQKYNKNLTVIGITNETNELKLSQFIEEYKLDFKIYRSVSLFNDIITFMKNEGFILNTPIKLFINKRNEIIAIEKGTKDISTQRLFTSRIQQIFIKE